jgi:hypothetical protein
MDRKCVSETNILMYKENDLFLEEICKQKSVRFNEVYTAFFNCWKSNF